MAPLAPIDASHASASNYDESVPWPLSIATVAPNTHVDAGHAFHSLAALHPPG
jgi:hypothetical protein